MTAKPEEQPLDSATAEISRWGAQENRSRVGPAQQLVNLALEYAVVIALILLIIVARVLYPNFLALQNIREIFSQNAQLALVALGVTYCLIAGVFDLSVGSVAGLGTLAAAALSDHGIVVAFLGAIVVGALAGSVNAFVVTKLNVNAFIATLGTQTIFLGAGTLYSTAPIMVTNAGLLRIGFGRTLGIPTTVVIVGILFLVAAFVLSKTVYGRVLYILGGNAEAARLAGMRVQAARGSVFLVSGVCAALAGLLLVTVVGNGQGSYGADYTLSAYAMVVVGGTSLFGGEGAIWRTAAGVLIIAITTDLFNSLAWSGAAQDLVIGGVLILAVALDSFARARRA